MMRHPYLDPYPCYKALLARHGDAALASAWSLVSHWVNADALSRVRAYLSRIGSVPLLQTFEAWASLLHWVNPEALTPLTSSSEDSSEREAAMLGRLQLRRAMQRYAG